MRQSILIIFLGLALVQAFPGNEIPEIRASITAKTALSNTINGLLTKVSVGTTAINNIVSNTTLNAISTVANGILFFKNNIRTATTQGGYIQNNLNMNKTVSAYTLVLFTVATNNLQTGIQYLSGLPTANVASYQTTLSSIITSVNSIITALKSTETSTTLASTTTTDATYGNIGTALTNIATLMNDVAVAYANLLKIPAVVNCEDYDVNGLNTNLAKIVTNNYAIMSSILSSTQSTLSSFVPQINGVLPFLQNGISDPFSGIQAKALIIEQDCYRTTTTTTQPTTTTDWPDCTTPARRSYESWGLGTLTSFCTWSLPTLVQTFDTINDQITTDVTNAAATAASYITNDLTTITQQIDASVNSINSQLMQMFGSAQCTVIFPCVNASYISLTNIVKQTYQALPNCVANVSINMQTNASDIITDYTLAKNALESAVNDCGTNLNNFDACMQAQIDPTFPVTISGITTDLTAMATTDYIDCVNTIISNYQTSLSNLKSSFKTCSGVTLN